MVLACVIAKDWKDDQCHLVGQMIGNGEPLHARGQADEVLLGFGLDILADSLVDVGSCEGAMKIIRELKEDLPLETER